jgi:integration host factor subunit alpha
LSEAVYKKVGLSRLEAADLVDQVLGEIGHCLAAGEPVKLSGFGLFDIRDKGRRVGRNPRTGIEVPIEPRRVVTFRSSDLLKAHVNGNASKTDV